MSCIFDNWLYERLNKLRSKLTSSYQVREFELITSSPNSQHGIRAKVLNTRATWQRGHSRKQRSKFGLKRQINSQERLSSYFKKDLPSHSKDQLIQENNLCHQRFTFKTLLEEDIIFWRYPLSSRIQEHLYWRFLS